MPEDNPDPDPKKPPTPRDLRDYGTIIFAYLLTLYLMGLITYAIILNPDLLVGDNGIFPTAFGLLVGFIGGAQLALRLRSKNSE